MIPRTLVKELERRVTLCSKSVRNARPFVSGGAPSTEKQRQRRRAREQSDNRASSSILEEVDKIIQRQRNVESSSSKAANPTLSRNKKESPSQKQTLKPPSTKSNTSIDGDHSSRPESSSFLDRALLSQTESNKSLFDVFRIPDEDPKYQQPTSNNGGVDAEAWKQYHELLEEAIATHRKHKKSAMTNEVAIWLRSEELLVAGDLPCLQHALEDGMTFSGTETNSNSRGTTFRSKVEAQKQHFKQQMNWDSKQYELAQGTIFYIASMCAKHAKGLPVQVLWEKVKEAGFIDQGLLQTLLYVSATFSSGNRRKNARYARLAGATILDVLEAVEYTAFSNSVDKINDVVKVEDLMDRTDEIAIFYSIFHQPTEQTVSITVRLLVAQGKSREAEAFLNQHSETVELRLRAYSPVLKLYLEQGDVGAALSLYNRMRKMPLLHLDADTYVSLLSGLAENGYFRPSAPSIQAAKELGYSCGSGPELLDDLVTEMADDIIEIPMTSAKRLYNAFAEGFPDSHLKKTTSLSPLSITTEPAAASDLIANRVVVDPANGYCSRSGVNLRLINLEEAERVKLTETIHSLARDGQIKFQEAFITAPTGRNATTKADAELVEFHRWLDERKGEPFTAIVDGANVGYYLQNFEHGRFSFHQIQYVVETLESLGENVLVVLPSKYTQRWFYVTIGAGGSAGPRKQVASAEESNIIRRLIDSGKAFIVPTGLLDDYYWILASISKQTKSRNGRDLHVAPGNSEGRWPGARPFIISNDQMRDHKLEMLEPRLFSRWYSNFLVNYNFTGFVGENCPNAEIGFSSADFFSREIQGNKGSDAATVWHFPIADTEDEWFCLRVPTRNGQAQKDHQ